MLWLIALVLFAVWGIAVALSITGQGLVHVLLIAASVVALVRVVQGSRVLP